MPRQDGTGPEGKGPLTGRRMGNCNQAVRKLDGTGPEGKGPLTGRGMGNCEEVTPKRGVGFFRFGRNSSRDSPRRANFGRNSNN